MNPDVRKLWTNALRSDKYKQGTNALCADRGDGDEYCCLGVLCDLAVKAGVDISVSKTDRESRPGDRVTMTVYDGAVAYPPPAVWEWAGLKSYNPRAGEHALGKWNDHMDADFHKIADLIDKHL